MWRKTIYSGASVLMALAIAGQSLNGQVGAGPRGPGGLRGQPGFHLGKSVNLALENGETLELTQEQAAQLQELKALLDGDIQELSAEMKGLREDIRTGEVPRDEGRREMMALRGELMTASAPLLGRVQEILTVRQHTLLQALVERPGQGPGQRGPIMGNHRSPRPGRGVGPARGRVRSPEAGGRHRPIHRGPRGGGDKGS